MENLINDSYNFELVDADPKSFKYDFVSVGEKEIPKRVVITQFENRGLERYFNLGFGNISIDEDGIEQISDMSRDNNKNDADKVLKTVFTCALDFLSVKPESIIVFYGNTAAKHRLYKIGLNNNLRAISHFFNVRGAIIPNLKIGVTADDEKMPVSPINVNTIGYEVYSQERSTHYTFFTFTLKQEFL